MIRREIGLLEALIGGNLARQDAREHLAQHAVVDALPRGGRDGWLAVSETAGEGGRVGIRILPGSDPGYPVRVELEIGRRGSEPDALALRVAERLLRGQGARVKVDGQRIGISLRRAPAESAQTVSNR